MYGEHIISASYFRRCQNIDCQIQIRWNMRKRYVICASNKDSNQHNRAVLSKIRCPHVEIFVSLAVQKCATWTDQTGRMRRQIWIVDGRTCPWLRFLMFRLKCKKIIINKNNNAVNEITMQYTLSNHVWSLSSLFHKWTLRIYCVILYYFRMGHCHLFPIYVNSLLLYSPVT